MPRNHGTGSSIRETSSPNQCNFLGANTSAPVGHTMHFMVSFMSLRYSQDKEAFSPMGALGGGLSLGRGVGYQWDYYPFLPSGHSHRHPNSHPIPPSLWPILCASILVKGLLQCLLSHGHRCLPFAAIAHLCSMSCHIL